MTIVQFLSHSEITVWFIWQLDIPKQEIYQCFRKPLGFFFFQKKEGTSGETFQSQSSKSHLTGALNTHKEL